MVGRYYMGFLIHTSIFKGRAGVGAALAAFIISGLYLFIYSLDARAYSSDQIVWDLQWLNAWSILFCLILLAVWASRLAQRLKIVISLCCFSIWGVVAVGLMFDGTPFGWNAYWGDQQFRTAMILKFMSFAWPTDFYYKGLPPFYPPLYFYLLSLYARLFSLEAYQMLKTGTFFIFLMGPGLLYYFWTKLVSRFQAFCITLATFLFQPAVVFAVPHEFLSGIFFIPWWLYFVEQIKVLRRGRLFVLIGGLIGAAIFLTYYYAFFLGGILLVIKAVLAFRRDEHRRAKLAHCKRMWTMIAAAALFSAPYWAPLLLSMLAEGCSTGQNRWFRIGYAGMDFPFLEFSLAGILTFGGLIYALRRYFTSVNRGLLMLAATVPLFLLIGYVLGNLGMPVLYVKAFEFLKHQSGVFIGLAVAGVLRFGRGRKQMRYATAVGVSVLMLVFLGNFTALIHQRVIEIARKARPDVHLADIGLQMDTHGKVFLTSVFPLPVFLASHMFIAPGEHYSHPAGRFHDRLEFLKIIQSVDDPYIFWAALRYNIYDPVDYVMPKINGEHFEIPVNISNYPNGLATKIMKYGRGLLADSMLFVREKGDYLYGVRESIDPATRRQFSFVGMTARDSLRTLRWARDLTQHLDSTGDARIADHLGADLAEWRAMAVDEGLHKFGDLITLLSTRITTTADSMYLIFEFAAKKDITSDYKIFLHICDQKVHQSFDNFDFWPSERTTTWERGDVIQCIQSIPKRAADFDYHLGFFIGEHRLDDGHWGEHVYDTGQPEGTSEIRDE
jgi:galactan 5-O-arabinofuranosyltransferase